MRLVRVLLAVSVLAPSALVAQRAPAVEAYVFKLQLPDAGKRIAGQATVIFAKAPTTDSVDLNLASSMKVSGVTAGTDSKRGVGFRQSGDTLRVAMPSGSSATTARRTLNISYAGEPTDGLIISTDTAGRWRAFGDNFPNRARFWLPTVDHPSAKARVQWEIEAPSDRVVVANGSPAGQEPRPNGRAVTRWREDRAIPTYDMVIAVAPLVMTDLGPTACGHAENGGCVPQMVYTAPEQARYMPGNFARAGEIVTFFAKTVAPFPYEKLAHLQTSTRYGGMENASEIYYADIMFRTPKGAGEGVISHETAHQWFGNAVTEREWAHVWLSEGFATFFETLWMQHAHGDSAYRAELIANRDGVIRAPETATRSVIDSIETDPNRLLNHNSYQKGGWVLHMLRTELGDSTFFRGIRAYYLAHRHANALTQDLQAAMEAAAGRPLGWFFDQWLRRPGFAEVTTDWSWDQATHRVTLSVNQGARFGAYRGGFDVDVVGVSGPARRVHVSLDGNATQQIVLEGEYAERPAKLVMDPTVTWLAKFTAK